MSFIVDFFTHAQDKERESPAALAEQNRERLKGYQAMEEKQRAYVQWCERKPKVPFANEKSHPMYEQRTRMYPHLQYTRRNADGAKE